MNKKEILIIGGGPGGYVAAIRAAQLGANVTLFENDKVGGTCLNRGCIPTKVLLHTTEMFSHLKSQESVGLFVEKAKVDWTILGKRRDRVVRQLVGGVKALLKGNGVTLINKFATVGKNGEVICDGESYKGDALVIATGSEPVVLPLTGADLEGVIDSTAGLVLKEVPESMVIIGGGVIGVEFAQIYAALGTKITIVELAEQILPTVDQDIVKIIEPILVKSGIKILTSSGLKEIKKTDIGLVSVVSVNGEEVEISAEKVLISVGRRPLVANLGLEEAGIKTDRGTPIVDQKFLTNVPNVYAIGDLNRKNMLAHAASAQGIYVVEGIMGIKGHYNGDIVPACIYTSPEIASVGITEEQAKANGIDYKVSVIPLRSNGKSIIENNGVGLVKLISAKADNQILGGHIIGPRATDMIAEIALAMNMKATAEDLAATIHPHPTISEALQEAAHGLIDGPIHWLTK